MCEKRVVGIGKARVLMATTGITDGQATSRHTGDKSSIDVTYLKCIALNCNYLPLLLLVVVF